MKKMGSNFGMHNKRSNIKFRAEYPYVIICEGKDEYAFLLAYLEYLERNDALFIDCHNVIDFGGITDVAQGIKNLKMYLDFADARLMYNFLGRGRSIISDKPACARGN